MICDVSKYQGVIDWGQVSGSLDFAILRSSVGMKKDERYAEYVSGCTRYKVPYHAYHYIKATDETAARNEAKVMAEATAGSSPLFYVIDAEYNGIKADQARAICEAFEDGLRHYIDSGIRVAVYIGHHLYKSWALDYGRYAYVWIPRYGSNNGQPQTPPDYPCDIWQYTSKGTLPGISGDVDLDRLMGAKPLSYFTNPIDEKESDTMATVKLGSARIDENGNATGGKAGDQTGKEVSTQNWYKHSKGWRVFRAKAPAVAEKIAWDMQAACDNPKIGYDQNQRDTLYTVAKLVGFNCTKVQTACETDCSALVRVCCAYAGVMLPNIRTITEPKALLDSGAFVELTGAKYTDSPDYLRRGDILCTKTQGHTGVVLSNGGKAGDTVDGLSKGDYGTAVTAMQQALLAWDPKCLPKWGADGDFGSETEKAVKAFQRATGLPETGVYDEATRKALTEKPAPPVDDAGTDDSELSDEPVPPLEPTGRYVEILPIHVRSAPGDQYMSLGTVQPGYRLPYQGETHKDANGVPWHLVEYDGQNGWLCEKDAEVI